MGSINEQIFGALNTYVPYEKCKVVNLKAYRINSVEEKRYNQLLLFFINAVCLAKKGYFFSQK